MISMFCKIQLPLSWLSFLAFLLLAAGPVNAQTSASETVGDVLQIAIPAAAYGLAHFSGDREGEIQFLKSCATNLAVTYGLQFLTNKQSPDRSSDYSFPSAHASMTAQGATFIQRRYGWQYSIPAYAGVIYTGYSRINANKHDVGDVIAGEAIGLVSSYLFTTPYMGITFMPSASNGTYSLNILKEW
jgi:membrane-associated phospholipid phosphatase